MFQGKVSESHKRMKRVFLITSGSELPRLNLNIELLQVKSRKIHCGRFKAKKKKYHEDSKSRKHTGTLVTANGCCVKRSDQRTHLQEGGK